MNQDQLINLLNDPNFSPSQVKISPQKLTKLLAEFKAYPSPWSSKINAIERIAEFENRLCLVNFFGLVEAKIPKAFKELITEPLSRGKNIAFKLLDNQGVESLLYFLQLVSIKLPRLLYKFILTPDGLRILMHQLATRNNQTALEEFFTIIQENLNDYLEDLLLIENQYRQTIGHQIAISCDQKSLQFYFDLISASLPNSIDRFVTLPGMGQTIALNQSVDGLFYFLNYVLQQAPEALPTVLLNKDYKRKLIANYIATRFHSKIFFQFLDIILDSTPDLIDKILTYKHNGNSSKYTNIIEDFILNLSSSKKADVVAQLKQEKYAPVLKAVLKSSKCLGKLVTYFPAQANDAFFKYLQRNDIVNLDYLCRSKFVFQFSSFKDFLENVQLTEDKKIQFYDIFDKLLHSKIISYRMHEAVFKAIEEIKITDKVKAEFKPENQSHFLIDLEPTQTENANNIDQSIKALNESGIFSPKNTTQPQPQPQPNSYNPFVQ